ncbi:MAG TPA: methylenetetrahydrofolate reductase [Saprospiraceae bacterium]|nr:methylenetetrahydrofolate reductase [Saprospiraceae bacterium]MCB9327983.1 methylenetetrahydrofolate reductase [Lewinellaceae bacterium]HRX28040.1 methylenetetrahydrofolate reductase [Saprospiraceae bacterium]
MKVTDYISNTKEKTFVSFEVLPPLKGGSMQDIFTMLDPLMEFKPPFIDVTYHREEFVYNKKDSGHYEKTSIRKRPGTVGICASIMHRYGIDAIPHLICGGFSIAETENALIDLHFLGINNVLALRGDARQFEDRFIPESNGHHYAVDLVSQINDMNQGKYLDTNIENGSKTDFCIGIAGYPEKHFESPNFNVDLQFTKSKIDAGGDYIVTQMFFDNSKYFDYVAACRNVNINVPIIAGLKPITKKSQLTAIPRKFFVNLPEELVKEVLTADDKNVKEIGTEWCIEQAKELKSRSVPCIHIYTMGDVATTRKIAQAII